MTHLQTFLDRLGSSRHCSCGNQYCITEVETVRGKSRVENKQNAFICSKMGFCQFVHLHPVSRNVGQFVGGGGGGKREG